MNGATKTKYTDDEELTKNKYEQQYGRIPDEAEGSDMDIGESSGDGNGSPV